MQLSEKMPEDLDLDVLRKFKPIFHPTRLAILILLNRMYRVELAEMRRRLKIPWGTLESHFQTLVKHNLVSTRKEFSGDAPRLFAYLEPGGAKLLSEFMETMEHLNL